MNYLLILIVSTVSLILSADGKIPNYIRVCKRNEPQITECIKDSVLKLRDKLVSGIPELKVPPIDPLNLEHLDLTFGSGFKAEARNLTITGGKEFQIEDLSTDILANTYSFIVTVPEIYATGIYEIDTMLGVIPLKGRGPMTFKAKKLTGRGTLRGKNVMRGGKTYNWFPTMTLKFQLENYEIKLDNLFEGDPTIGEVTNKLLNEEKTEVLATLLPGLEKALIKHILVAANNICKNFTWDELFPES